MSSSRVVMHVGLRLLQDGDEDVVAEVSDTTLVLGVGVGVFVLIFFGVLALVGCFIAKSTNKKILAYVMITIFYTLLVIGLVLSPKESPGEEDTTKYNRSYYGRIAMLTVITVGSFIGLLCVFISYVTRPVYATPVRKLH